MADDSGLKPKTLKRKNVKGLMLKAEARPPAPPPDAAANNAGDDLSSRLGALEIGVEFKLDLRAEDLTVMNELGAGNGGTVSKVMHSTLKTVMAKKVRFWQGTVGARVRADGMT